MSRRYKAKGHKPQPNPVALAMRTLRLTSPVKANSKAYRRNPKHRQQESAA